MNGQGAIRVLTGFNALIGRSLHSRCVIIPFASSWIDNVVPDSIQVGNISDAQFTRLNDSTIRIIRLKISSN